MSMDPTLAGVLVDDVETQRAHTTSGTAAGPQNRHSEAYLVAQAEASGVSEIVSFDRSIDRVASITRREP